MAANAVAAALALTIHILVPSSKAFRSTANSRKIRQFSSALYILYTLHEVFIKQAVIPSPLSRYSRLALLHQAPHCILIASVISNTPDIYNGKRQYAYSTPLIIGISAIGCIAAAGPDPPYLTSGQLVHVDITIHGRDFLTAVFLSGIHKGVIDSSRKLTAW